ncbi:MAG: DUF4038 domain-containing protein [Candidatus Omnitrophota bacterium]
MLRVEPALRFFMKIAYFLLLFPLFVVTGGAYGGEAISIHKANFYLFEKEGKPFFPIGANAGFLMNLRLTDKEAERDIAEWSGNGINVLRIAIDSALNSGALLSEVETSDGELTSAVLSRLDFLIHAAEKRGMAVILILFDLQSMSENWEHHPYNRSQGGWRANLSDFFLLQKSRSQAIRRTKQLTARYKNRPILAWEIARGADAWNSEAKPDKETIYSAQVWFERIAKEIETNDPGRLKSISFMPNTLPTALQPELMGLVSLADFFLLHIRSKDAYVAAQSASQYIQMARDCKKPVFIGESTWTGRENEYEEFIRNIFWSAAASCSGSFLTPIEGRDGFRIPDSSRALCATLLDFLSYVELGGRPRPPSKSPIQAEPKDACLLVESMAGNDRIFWLLRKKPGLGQVQLTFHTIEGIYEYQWFDTESRGKGRNKEFQLRRQQLILQSPEFMRDCLGILRFKKSFEIKKEPNQPK